MSRNRYLLPTSLFFVLISSSVLAQEPSVFVDRIDVNIVNVEVFVTDGSGRHVEGLTLEDFKILEDGRPVEVTNFYTVKRASAPSRPEPEPRMPEPAATQTEETVEPPADQQLHLLVYIDNFNIRAANRKRVLTSLETFLLQRAKEKNLIMLVTYNRGLRTVLPFTGESERISEALRSIRKSQSNGLREDFRRRTAARDIAAALSEASTASQAQEILQRYIQESRANLLHSVNAIQAAVRGLAGLQGRKALLYVSDGLQQNPGQTLTEQFFGRQRLNANESALFNRVIREANAQQVTFYALDASGPAGASSVNAEATDEVGGGSNRGVLDARRTMNLQEPLIGMSEPTGGSSFLNTYNFDVAMDAMAEDFDRFYSLGYNSPRSGEGKYHRIEVKVNRPGLKVRHRSGYVDKPEVERVGDRTMSSLLVGSVRNPLGIRLEFQEPTKKGKSYLLPIMIRIPIRELALLPTGDTAEGHLQIFIAVQDSEGGVSPLRSLPYPVSIPSDQLTAARDSVLGYLTQLEIRPGENTISVGLWDETSGIDSFVRETVLVGKRRKSKS